MAGKTRRRLAAEQIAELVAIEKKIKALTRELKQMVAATGSTLMELPGVGPVVAARTLADTGDVARFTDRNRYASWTGTAPIEASSGEIVRHRLSRAGNRRMNPKWGTLSGHRQPAARSTVHARRVTHFEGAPWRSMSLHVLWL